MMYHGVKENSLFNEPSFSSTRTNDDSNQSRDKEQELNLEIFLFFDDNSDD